MPAPHEVFEQRADYYASQEQRLEQVVGLLFNEQRSLVALIEKNSPAWQEGLLNGLGGKIELGETPLDAMRREFMEEAQVQIDDWRYFCRLVCRHTTVHFFMAIRPGAACYTGDTDEGNIQLYMVDHLFRLPLVPGLHWQILLALDKSEAFAKVGRK